MEDIEKPDSLKSLKEHLRLDTIKVKHLRKGPLSRSRQNPEHIKITLAEYEAIAGLYNDDINMFGYSNYKISDLAYS